MRADLANLAQPPVALPPDVPVEVLPDVPVEVLPDASAPAYRINTEELPLKYQADIRWLRERANDIPLCTAICFLNTVGLFRIRGGIRQNTRFSHSVKFARFCHNKANTREAVNTGTRRDQLARICRDKPKLRRR